MLQEQKDVSSSPARLPFQPDPVLYTVIVLYALENTITKYLKNISGIPLGTGSKYIPLPGWLVGWADLTPRLLPLSLLAGSAHSWLAIFLPQPNLPSLPPGITVGIDK